MFDKIRTPLPAETVHEHVKIFLKTTGSISIGHLASAGVLMFIANQNPTVSTWFLLTWGLFQIVIYPICLVTWRRSYLRLSPEDKKPYLWIWMMDLLGFVVGLSWGLMLYVSLNPDNVAHFAIQMSIAAGTTSATIRSLATFPRSFIFYVIPFLGLLALRVFWLGGDFILLSGLVLVFMIMLLRFGRDVLESVTEYIEISLSNLDLARRYEQAASEAEHANREKTRLLAAASHDLRQPIHAIGLYLESLQTDRLDERSQNTLARVRSSLQTLSKLFNSLLDVSLLDSGRIQIRTSVFDLQDLLNHVLDDYEPLAEIAHVTLILECPRLGVVGDPVLVRRMVQNLLSNAIRYAEGGSVSIEVTQQDRAIAITVSDDGPGIPKESLDVIFEEFTQISHRRNPGLSDEEDSANGVKGLGLGLAIVRRLANVQNCTIEVQTGPEGTAIAIQGLEPAPLSAVIQAPKTLSDSAGARFGQKRILVVDDDWETLQATCDLLRKWGCQVLSAQTIENALDLGDAVDLVISDFTFGAGYTGIDVVRQLRAKYGEGMRALIISGNSSHIVRDQVAAEGLLLIYKPVQPVQLRSAMLDQLFSNDGGRQILS